MVKDNLYKRILLLLFLVLATEFNSLNCQDHWNELTSGRDFFSGIPVSCADVNGDAIDDLLILDQGKKLWLGLNNGFGYF